MAIGKSDLEKLLFEHVDRLASIEHERWAHWQSYLHSEATKTEDGDLIIPKKLVDRWERQMRTTFSNLDESEKDSDREQVARYIPVIVEIINLELGNNL